MAYDSYMKIRVLAVAKMLCEGKRLSTDKILERLKREYGICADRKTIMSDIVAIDRFFPISSKSGKYGGYKRYAPFKEAE